MRCNEKYYVGLLYAVIILVSLCFLFTNYAVPLIIEQAYHGKSLSFLNSIIEGQGTHPVEYYIAEWRRLSQGLLAFFIISILPFIAFRWTCSSSRGRFESRLKTHVLPDPIYVNTLCSAIIICITVYLYYCYPVEYVYFVVEDGWAEYGTFAGLWIAFLVFMSTLIWCKELRRPGLIIIVLFAFIVAMEEISWGQRIFGFSTPEYILSKNRQGETNIHNFDLVSSNSERTLIVAVILLWCIPFYFICRASSTIRSTASRLGVPVIPIHLWPFFIASSTFLYFRFFDRSAEIGELFFGIGFAALAINVAMTRKGAIKLRGPLESLATLLMLMYLVVFMGVLVHFFSPPGNAKPLLNFFAAEDLQEKGLYRQAEKIFNYLDRNSEYLETETSIAHGRLLLKTGRALEATKVLEAALVDLERLRHQNPNDVTAIRNVAKALKVLNRHGQSESVFQEAVSRDEARLRKAKNPIAELEVQISLYVTYLEMEDCNKVKEQIAVIRSLKPPARYLNDPKLRRIRARSSCER